MSVIHIATPEGKREVYPEDQVRDIWLQGFIPESSVYWQPGMPEWRPAREYFQVQPGTSRAVAASEPPEAPGYQFVKDPTAQTRLLTMLLWVSVGLDVISPLAAFFAKAEGMAPVIDLFNAIDLFNSATTSVVFLTWIYWANRNSHGFGAKCMQFKAGWAVGFYFVPIFSLFRPYQSMREIWQISKDPERWIGIPSSPVLVWWWTLWIVAGLVGQVVIVAAAMAKDDPRMISVITAGNYVMPAVHLALCLVAIRLVGSIYRQQVALVEGR